jgi:hypothetical protein
VSATPEHDEFDAYRVWLGIPKAEQPPHHYRLLGVTLFETDPQVIQEGADRQIAHLKTKQTGKHVALSQQLLQQVTAAAGCLLDTAAKERYDEQLRQRLAAQAAPQASLNQPGGLPPGYPPPMPGQQMMPAHQQPVGYPQHYPQHQTPLQPVAGGHYAQPQYQQHPGYHPTPPSAGVAPRPIPVQQPAAAVAVEEPPTPTSTAPVLTGVRSGSSAGVHGRRHAKGFSFELMKIVAGGLLGIAIAIGGFAMAGRLDVIYGLVGMSPSNQVTQVEPAKGSNSSSSSSLPQGSGANIANPATNPPSTAGSASTGPATSNPTTSNPTTTGTGSTSPPGTQDSTSADPANGNANLPSVTNSPITPARLPAPVPHRLAGPPPTLPAAATLQDATAAFREGVTYAAQLYNHLQTSMQSPTYRQLFEADQATLQRLASGELSTGTIPTEEPQLSRYRSNLFSTFFDNVDRTAVSNGGKPFLSGRLIAATIIPTRTSSPGPVGRIHESAPDDFGDQLSQYIQTLCGLAEARQQEPEVHDHLCYLAAMCRGLQFSYMRGNADQFATCQLIDGLCNEVGNLLSPDRPQDMELKQKLRTSRESLFRSLGLGDSALGNDLARDPRKVFRTAESVFTWQADGSWVENHNARGESVYTERKRTPLQIELHPRVLGQTPVYLALSWCSEVTVSPNNPNVQNFAYQSGAWEIPKSNRSLTPKLAIQFPKHPDLVALSGTNPGSNPGTAPGSPSGTGLTNPLASVPVNTSGLPTATIAGGKKLWRYPNGFIELTADGTWREFSPTGDYLPLQLVTQAGDMVEFRRPVGDQQIRVYDNRLEYDRLGYGQFTEVAKGSWIKPLEDIALDPPQQAGLKRTVDQFQDTSSRARKNMLDAFEKAMSSNRKRIGKNDERLAQLEILRIEKDRFEKEGLVPWSSLMKQETSDYLATMAKARMTADQTLSKAVDYYLNQNQLETAQALVVMKQKLLAPVVVARFLRRDGVRYGSTGSSRSAAGAPLEVQEQIMREQMVEVVCNGTFRFWSNGALNDASGASKWLPDAGGIWLNMVRSGYSPTRERIVLSDNGKDFVGKGGYGSDFSGNIMDSLGDTERRPEFVLQVKSAAKPAVDPSSVGTTSAEPKPAPAAKPADGEEDGDLRFPAKKRE